MHGQLFGAAEEPGQPSAAQNNLLPYGKELNFYLIYHPCIVYRLGEQLIK